MAHYVGLNWQLTSITGWGVFGTQLAFELQRSRRAEVVLLRRPMSFESAPHHRSVLDGLLARYEQMKAYLAPKPQGRGLGMDFVVVQPLRPQFLPVISPQGFYGQPDVGVIFFEDTNISDAGRERARHFPRVIAGSTWNAELMRAAGIEGVRTVFQGVDCERFAESAAQREQRVEGPGFHIFSGGKFEYRKGQDIVLAAFRIFQERHPEAVLHTCWQNPWREKVDTMLSSRSTVGVPAIADKYLDVVGWSVANGVPEGSVIDLGFVYNHRMPSVLARMDCGVFPSRYESGTNLFAMECMAAGLPVALSANTGHLDIIGDGHCYPVEAREPVPPPRPEIGNEGWSGCSVESLLAAMEEMYRNRAEAKQRGQASREFMASWSWANQVSSLADVIDEVR